jgi:copper transport protein
VRGARSVRGVRGFVVATGLAAAVVAGVVAGSPSPAGAHATLLETTPADDAVVEAVPSTVELRYSEAVDVGSGGIEVYDPDGDRVDLGTVDVLEDGLVASVPLESDAPGTYTVAWRVTSEDGHTINGSFVFHVGTETGGVEIDDTTPTLVKVVGFAGRWLAFAGSLVVLGALLVRLLAGSDRQVEARLRRLGVVAAVVATAGALVALLATTAEATGRDLGGAFGLVGDFVGDQRTGTLAALRAGMLAAGAVALVVLRGRLAAAVTGAATVASMVVVSLAGHAWTTTPRGLILVTDVVHQVAVGIWIGGLVGLLAVLGVAIDRDGLSRRFSAVALATVAVVAATGTASAWAQVRTFDALVDTSYGQLMLVKVTAFLVLVALGWLNRSRLLATVERTIAPLTRSLRAEAAIAVVIVGVTAGLVAQQPARLATASGPFEATVTDTDATMTLQAVVDPAEAGANDVHLYFYGPDGTEPADVLAVEVEATTGDLPSRGLEVTPFTTSHVSAVGASLSTPGDWDLSIVAVGADGARATFTLEVPIR